VYASPAPIQGAKDKPGKFDFATREGRKAYADEHRCIPPWLLPPAERRRRHADDAVEAEHERGASWLVAEIIFPMIERNSRRALGYCNATEYTLRLWAWIDTGHLYGERSISRRLRVEHARGRLHREVIPRGGRFKNGTESKRGTTANRFPSEKERRERLWREKHERRRQRREARQRKRAERVIARERKPAAPDIEAPRREQPRTAIAHVLEVECKLPPILRDALPPILRDVTMRPELLADAERDARQAEIARQRAAALARLDLWDRLDEPDD
jgi:hypothetical protein